VAGGSGKRGKKTRRGGRKKFRSSSQVRLNLESISAAQKKYRTNKRRAESATEEQQPRPSDAIIESVEKSERAWENELRKVRRPEDLDGFD
jgi:hypothetical protein